MALKGGLRLPVGMSDVFPFGCHLLPDSIAEAVEYDERTKTRRPMTDKVTGQRVWQCRVSDMDPALEGRSREVVVKILSDSRPVAPGRGCSRQWSSTAWSSPRTWTTTGATARVR
jgi:hypothetical protein